MMAFLSGPAFRLLGSERIERAVVDFCDLADLVDFTSTKSRLLVLPVPGVLVLALSAAPQSPASEPSIWLLASFANLALEPFAAATGLLAAFFPPFPIFALAFA